MFFINIYAPVVGVVRRVFLDILNEVIEKCTVKSLYFLEAILTVMSIAVWTGTIQEPHAASHTRLLQVMETHELCDVWRGFYIVFIV